MAISRIPAAMRGRENATTPAEACPSATSVTLNDAPQSTTLTPRMTGTGARPNRPFMSLAPRSLGVLHGVLGVGVDGRDGMIVRALGLGVVDDRHADDGHGHAEQGDGTGDIAAHDLDDAGDDRG